MPAPRKPKPRRSNYTVPKRPEVTSEVVLQIQNLLGVPWVNEDEVRESIVGAHFIYQKLRGDLTDPVAPKALAESWKQLRELAQQLIVDASSSHPTTFAAQVVVNLATAELKRLAGTPAPPKDGGDNAFWQTKDLLTAYYVQVPRGPQGSSASTTIDMARLEGAVNLGLRAAGLEAPTKPRGKTRYPPLIPPHEAPWPSPLRRERRKRRAQSKSNATPVDI